MGPNEFAQAMEAILDAGATVVGGCCGTTPDHIAALRALIDARPLPAVASVSVPAHTPVASSATAVSASSASSRAAWGEQSEPKGLSASSVPNLRYRPAFTVTSAQQMVSLPEGEARIAVIGERINPTGKKKLKAALQAGDVDYLVAEAAAQQRAGADILDVNVGVPGLDEPALLSQVTRALQATVPLPLQLDSSDPAAIEAAARAYAGRPMVNSVNGKADNLAAVLPVVARYGCTVVGLTLDENGIPPTAEERLAIAERIVAAAEAHGIPREDVAIDCLVMAAATNQDEVREILRAVTLVKERLGVRTVLGVSNVSFGLPARPLVNSTFLAAAFGAGLDMPILNPLNVRYRDTVATFRILNGQDTGCRAFLEAYANASDPYEVAAGSTPVGGDLGRPGYHSGGRRKHRPYGGDAQRRRSHRLHPRRGRPRSPLGSKGLSRSDNGSLHRCGGHRRPSGRMRAGRTQGTGGNGHGAAVGDPRRPGHHQRYLRSHPRRGRPEIRRGRVLPAPAHGLRRSRESRLRSHSRPRSGSRRKCR